MYVSFKNILPVLIMELLVSEIFCWPSGLFAELSGYGAKLKIIFRRSVILRLDFRGDGNDYGLWVRRVRVEI
jgi:hypothetical protein